MKNRNYRPRVIDSTLKLYLDTFGAVIIEGPKWCGKTWTGRNACKSEFLVADPKDGFNNKKIALINPDMVLEGQTPRLIDEWQEVPSLRDAVRGHVDLNTEKGQFILTGSASIDKNKYIHSGTGRIAHLKMRPMSLYESGYSDGKISLKDACENEAPNCLTGDVQLKTLVRYVLSGGWPSVIGMDEKKAILVSRQYIESVLAEDIYKTDKVKRDNHKVELLLRSLARNEATTATIVTLKQDIKEKDGNAVDPDTISDYLNLFNRLYLTENIPPFAGKIRSSMRVKQSEKRHFVDPSLPCALLHLTKDALLNDLEFFGFLFESMVERDLLTYVDAFNAKLYHYQDYSNNEIDAVIEMEDSSWCGVEIKLGANQIEDASKNLIRINEKITKDGGQPAKSLIVICGMTNAAYKRDDGVYVVPITSLKD